MGRRYRSKHAPGHYVERDKRGRFKNWTNIRRGISVDVARKAKRKGTKHGYGHLVDYPK